MELYNSLISETSQLLGGLSYRQWDHASAEAWRDSGISELVLQKNAAFELGAQGRGSANYVLFTSDPKIVSKDQIMLYGRDLGEIKGDVDFARIVLLRVGTLDDEDEHVYRTLKDMEYAKYHVFPEGYMVRMSPESYREQVRVSREAVKRGISFRSVGSDYINAYKKNLNVLNAAVIFVTDPGADYAAMQKLAKKANDITGTLTHIFEGLPTDCSVCALKDVCDEVEGMKELHFGAAGKEKR